jgi:hypothetical protein
VTVADMLAFGRTHLREGVAPNGTTPVDESIAGEYASFESRIILEPKGDNLVVTRRYEPFDEDHRRTIVDYIGGEEYLNNSATYIGVAPGQYSPEGAADAASLSGFLGRMRLMADLPAAPGRRPGLRSAFRYTPKIG